MPCSAGDRDDLVDRLQRADLVVGPHHRDERDRRGVPLDGLAERGDDQPALVVDRQQLELGALCVAEPVERVEHGVVLDRAGQHAGTPRVLRQPGPVDALDREVVGLRAAGGEHHLAGPAAERLRDGLPRLLHHPPGVPTGRVQRAGVADLEQVLRHRLDGRRHHRRGGGVVEVDGALGRVHSLPSVRPARQVPDTAEPARYLRSPGRHLRRPRAPATGGPIPRSPRSRSAASGAVPRRAAARQRRGHGRPSRVAAAP